MRMMNGFHSGKRAKSVSTPQMRPGGAAILWVGPSAEVERVAAAAARLAGEVEEAEGFLVLHKVGPTPAGYPRRPGIAKKRPLA